MKTRLVPITDVNLNADNPRRISDSKLKQLVKSILCFPNMLLLRPIVVDDEQSMTALGGNMRLKALQRIFADGIENAKYDIADTATFKELSNKEQDSLIRYWTDWFASPTVPVISASFLTDSQRKQFVIKDNSQFGSWDYDMLNTAWDKAEVTEWGAIADWNNATHPQPFNIPSVPREVVDAYNSGQEYIAPVASDENLPEELQGIDVTPDYLPKIEGDYETLKERIIISFTKEQAQRLASLLGLSSIEKVVYNIDELIC